MHSAFIFKNRLASGELKALGERYPELETSAMECFLALLDLAGALRDATESALARRGTSQGRLRVLLQLHGAPSEELAPGELARRLGVTPATVTGLLDGLSREGQVLRRRAAGDRRGVAVRMTARGRARLGEILPERFRRIAALMGGLSLSDRAELLRLLGAVAAGLPEFSRL